MKAALAILLLCATAHAKPTNGAFVGIGLEPAAGGCIVGTVIPDSNASVAGVHVRDPIVAVDGKSPVTCDQVFAAIGDKSVGDAIELVILDDRSHRRTVRIDVGTREEVLRRRFVGKRLPPVIGHTAEGDDVQVGVDPLTIYVFYLPGQCTGCASLASRIGTRVREHVAKTGEKLAAFAVEADELTAKGRKDEQARAAMPVAFVDALTYRLYTFDEVPALQAYVVDGHGVVQGVFRIGPSDDDIAARLDELFQIAAQVAHPR